MPTTIVTDTCPAPLCNLTTEDVTGLVTELEGYHAHFQDSFVRSDQARWAHAYLRGLLSDCPRKSIEPMALALGLPIRAMQAFLADSPWRTAPIVAAHQRLVAQTLGEADGVLLVDESALPKQGQQSVGVAPQYCGALGKVANCQVGVYVGYVSRKGYTLLEGQLFVPECWFDAAHAPLRQQTGMPTISPSRPSPNWLSRWCNALWSAGRCRCAGWQLMHSMAIVRLFGTTSRPWGCGSLPRWPVRC